MEEIFRERSLERGFIVEIYLELVAFCQTDKVSPVEWSVSLESTLYFQNPSSLSSWLH